MMFGGVADWMTADKYASKSGSGRGGGGGWQQQLGQGAGGPWSGGTGGASKW